jgi:CRP-like cAMP-binding protein/predicted MFS family arabinose efflux permease
MAEGRRRGAFRSALAHPDYRRLAFANIVSFGGDWLYNVAFVVFIYQQTHSPAWLGAAAAVRLVPYVLLGSLAGTLADRYDRQRVMVAADLFRLCCMLGVAADAAYLRSPVLALVIVFANNVASTAFGPAAAALTPRLVGEDDLAAANAVNATIEAGALVIGPAVGSLLLLLGSTPAAFVVNAGTYAVSAVLILTIKTHVPPVKVKLEHGPLHQVVDGFRALRDSPTAIALLNFEFGVSFLYGTSTVFFILVARQFLGTGSNGFGYLMAAMGLGGVVASPLAAKLLDRPHQILILAAGPIAAGLAVAGMVVHSLPLALVCAFVFGAGNNLVDVIALTLLQRAAPPRMVGRIFGVAFTAFLVSILLGTLVEPPLIALLGLQWAVVATGGGVALLTLIAIPTTIRLERNLELRRQELAPVADLLQGLSIFDGAVRSSLEMIAAAMTTVAVPPGTRVINQGDQADYFYVVKAGGLEVTRREEDGSERVVGHLAPGEYFGEIGLLQEGVRTANVIATEPTELYRVSGDEFVDGVNRGSALSGGLMATVAWRLASYEPPAADGAAAQPTPSPAASTGPG